jgi:hypothetical protein
VTGLLIVGWLASPIRVCSHAHLYMSSRRGRGGQRQELSGWARWLGWTTRGASNTCYGDLVAPLTHEEIVAVQRFMAGDRWKHPDPVHVGRIAGRLTGRGRLDDRLSTFQKEGPLGEMTEKVCAELVRSSESGSRPRRSRCALDRARSRSDRHCCPRAEGLDLPSRSGTRPEPPQAA